MQPIVNGLEAEFKEKIAFEQRNANSEEGKATMDTYALRAHPSYVIVTPDGKVLWSGLGEMQAEKLREQLRKFTIPSQVQ